MRNATTEQRWIVNPAGPEDRARWRELFSAYGVAADQPLTAAHLDLVWGWISDPAAQTRCLLLRDDSGHAIGLAHYRPFERPLAGSVGCYVDDLYVEPGSTGKGGATALLAQLSAMARAEGWTMVRWTTRHTNQRALALYDRLAERSPVVTFILNPSRSL